MGQETLVKLRTMSLCKMMSLSFKKTSRTKASTRRGITVFWFSSLIFARAGYAQR
jgi:hypothetical protein